MITRLDLQMSDDEYFSDPCEVPSLSQSIAHLLVTKSPLHAWLAHPKLGGKQRPRTAAMTEGAILDEILLNGGKNITVIDVDSFRTNAAKAARDNALACGSIPVTVDNYAIAEETADAIRRSMMRNGIDFDAGQKQVCAFWVEHADDGTAVQCKGRFDQLVGHEIRDLKKCRSAHPLTLEKHVVGYGYDIQAVAYMHALEANDPSSVGRVKWKWLFAENDPPNAVTIAEPTGGLLAFGEMRWRRAVNTWAACLKSNTWPGYDANGTVRVGVPSWAMTTEILNQSGDQNDENL